MNTHPVSGKKSPWPMLFGILAVLFLFACANVVSPTGGPRDEDPPEVVRSSPPNYSTNFDRERIRIFFNEFVQLRNIRQQLLISPPMERLPEVRIRGRSIIIDLEEELLPNTTYNMFFGDAIRDITEGNAIPNFQFVFSTGDYVDSLSVAGQVKNALNLQPEQGVYVMMYSNIYDSVPYLERPVYLAKTDKEGRFLISNMADGEYLMFALDDKNNNFRYDMPGERIAFLDSLIRPRYIPPPVKPTEEMEEELPDMPTEEAEFPIRPTPTPEDSLPARPIDRQRRPAETPHPEYTLYMFQEADTVQRVTSSALEKKGLIVIGFRIPFDSAHVREIREPFEETWHIPEFSQNKDSLKIWFAETGRDSLFLEVWDRDRVLDTIRRPTVPRRVRERAEEQEVPPLNIGFDFRRPSAVPHFRPLGILSEHPVQSVDTGKIQLYIHDSIPMASDFLFKDHVRRHLVMEPELLEGTSYFMEILPGAFTDIFGLTNDTIQRRFATTTRENFGNLILQMTLPPDTIRYILQLLDRGQAVLDKKFITESGTYTFEHLNTGEYRVRLIEDLNENDRWDPGHYLRKIQPEPVHMLRDTLRIRENWDVEMPWVIQSGGAVFSGQ